MIFASQHGTGAAALCRARAFELLNEVARGLWLGVRHEKLIFEAALLWRNAVALERKRNDVC